MEMFVANALDFLDDVLPIHLVVDLRTGSKPAQQRRLVLGPFNLNPAVGLVFSRVAMMVCNPWLAFKPG